MSSHRRVLLNILAQFVTNLLVVLSSFVITALIGRAWGPESLGEYAFVTSFVLLFTFLSVWSLDQLFVRELARRPERIEASIATGGLIALAFSLVTFLLVVLVAQSLRKPTYIVHSIALAALWLVLGGWTNLLRSVFYAKERMHVGTVVLLIEKCFALALAVPYIMREDGLVGLFLILVASRIVSLVIIGYTYWRKIGPIRLRYDAAMSRYLLRESAPFALNFALTPLYIHVDSLLLSFLWGDQELGYFRAASAIILQLPIVATAFNSALLPRFSQRKDQTGVHTGAQLSFRYMSMFGFPLAVGLFTLAEPIISVIYSAAFEPSVVCLQILAFMLPSGFVNATLGMLLTAGGYQSKRTRAVVMVTAFKLITAAVLIFYFGRIGASLATTISVILLSVLLYASVRKLLTPLSLRAALRPLAAALVMGAVLWLVQASNADWSVWLLMPLGAVVYLAVLIATGGFSPQDTHLLKSLITLDGGGRHSEVG